MYAVVQGTRTLNPHTPLTPHSPGSRPHPLAPSSNPAPSSASSTRPHGQAVNPKKLRRSSSSSLSSSSSSSDCYFTLHALKSRPGSVGQLVRVSFRCPTPDTAETWVEQITHQMQSEWGQRSQCGSLCSTMYCVVSVVLYGAGGGGELYGNWRSKRNEQNHAQVMKIEICNIYSTCNFWSKYHR